MLKIAMIAVPVVGAAVVAYIYFGSSNAFVDECVKRSQGSKSQCSCAFDSIKASVKPEYREIVALTAAGKQNEIEQAVNKLGLLKMMEFGVQMTGATQIANKSCGTKMG